MSVWIRRTLIGVGAALLVGGWGLTRYAHAQQQIMGAGAARYRLWVGMDAGGRNHEEWRLVIGSRVYYGTGVMSMAVGAGLIGFGAIRTNKEAG